MNSVDFGHPAPFRASRSMTQVGQNSTPVRFAAVKAGASGFSQFAVAEVSVAGVAQTTGLGCTAVVPEIFARHPENLAALHALGRHTSCRTSRRTAVVHLNDCGMQVAPQVDIRYAMARSQAVIAVPGIRLPHILKANEGEEPTMACSKSVLHHGQGMTPTWPLTLFFLPAQRSPSQGQQRA